jgi:hypothetical protein
MTALIIFSDVGGSAKKYKMANFNPKPSNFEFFGRVPKSPTHTDLICVKNPVAEYLKLGPL